MNTKTTTAPSWLEQAEAEYAAAEAERTDAREESAQYLADEINDRLAELGITPVIPARTNGYGDLSPAVLVERVRGEMKHGVFVSWDEEEHRAYLLADVYDSAGNFAGLRAAGHHLGDEVDAARARYLVALVRRQGPAPLPTPPARPSADAQAIVTALAGVEAALIGLAHAVGRP